MRGRDFHGKITGGCEPVFVVGTFGERLGHPIVDGDKM